MSQMQRRGLPHTLSASITALGACAMLLTLTGCTELARFIGKADPKPEEAVVAEEATAQPIDDRVEGPVEKPKPSKLYEWNGDGRKVSRIVIDTDKQRASFFVGEDEIGWSTVASGLPKHPTPTGQFAVMEKVENKRSNLYGKVVKNGKVVHSNAKAGRDPIPAGARFEGAHMPYFMRLTYDGIGLHAGPIPRPGQPASHGCIRLPSTLAPVLFQHVSHGTQVTIVGSGPSYGNYVEKQRVAAERAKRVAEQRRIAQANAAAEAAASGADVTPDAASAAPAPATSRPRAVSRPDQHAATTASAETSPAPDEDAPAADPAVAPPPSAPAPSTASAAPRDPSPTSNSPAAEPPPAPSVTSVPAAATESPANASRTVEEPAAPPSPEQARTAPSPAAPPETKPTTIAETAPAVDVPSPPAQSSTPPVTPPAPQAQTPAPSAAAPTPAPAPAAPPAEPAAPPAQAQQAPAAAAPGSDG